MIPSDFLDNLARFWSKVDRRGPNECWPWTGELNNQGYGRFELWHHGQRTRILAHRMALTLAGRGPATGSATLHRCDNPPCVNPDHLAVGTQLDNVRDARAKGRMDLGGLTADTDHDCRLCGAGFPGAPSRRYCDACQVIPPSTRWRRARDRELQVRRSA